MQHLAQLGKSGLAYYNEYIQGDHDYRVFAQILTMEEKPTSQSVELLDGQVNLQSGEGPRRTASIVLSDPENALSFGGAFATDDSGVLWVNRMIRICHEVRLPGYGLVTSTPFVGVPTSVKRSGPELGLECADKSLLANQGAREKTYKQGSNAAAAIRDIMRNLTGERKYHIPNSSRKITKKGGYTVGMSDPATLSPWVVARAIASKELGWRLEYMADGWLIAESKGAARDVMPVKHLLDFADSSLSFTEFINYARVSAKGTVGKKNYHYTGVAQTAAKHPLSPQSLNRNGVPRYLPLVLQEDSLNTQGEVNQRASQELFFGSGLDADSTFSTIPFFHLDDYDTLALPLGAGNVPFINGSIPLGVGGPMSVGSVGWVSRPVKVRGRATRYMGVRDPKKKKSKKPKDD